jgi:DnaJ-class molecular chaperone
VVTSPQSPTEWCPECEGRGTTIDSAMPCLKCKGKGLVSK